ncbi:MAG: MFS transporter [Acidobacteriota bacterium]|nr:MFS transporter [Acidobacteriota bacterium]
MSTVKQNLSSDGNSTGSGYWARGFLLLGVFLAVLGSLLIDWDYHIDVGPRVIGLHFLGLGSGYGIGAQLARLRRWEPRTMAMLGCGAGFAGLLALAFLAPPIAPLWRILTLAVIGLAAGMLATALLFALEPSYVAHPIRTLNRSGAFFGIGCLIATFATALFYWAGWHHRETAVLSLLPLGFLLRYARMRPETAITATSPNAIEDLRLIAAFLFTMLLFFQFGNEWAMAGWVPLFLIHTLGSSPEYAIFALVVYFAALTLGRILAQRVAGNVGRRRLLIASIVVAMSGYLLLGMAHSLADGYVGIVITALGFGPIYPLALKSLDERFRYQARLYSRILSIAITGGLLVPWLLGYVDDSFGMRPVMLVPALGSVAVLALALLIMLEARLMGGAGISVQSNLV